MIQLVTLCSQLWSRKIWVLVLYLFPVFLFKLGSQSIEWCYLYLGWAFPAVKPLRMQSYRHTMRYVSMVTLHLVMLRARAGFIFITYSSASLYISLWICYIYWCWGKVTDRKHHKVWGNLKAHYSAGPFTHGGEDKWSGIRIASPIVWSLRMWRDEDSAHVLLLIQSREPSLWDAAAHI